MKLYFVMLAWSALSIAIASALPITQVVMDINHLHKWDQTRGDTWDPFWADDDNLYAFNCDGFGFGTSARNLALNQLAGPDLLHLKGKRINDMDAYGLNAQKAADGATWKVCGQECIDGVFYAFVCRNTYGKDSHDPLMRQTSVNASLIKSNDRGLHWARSEAENYANPMWPGSSFGAPGFFHYGKNGGTVTQDHADQYVYALSNNGFWNGGDDFILGRVSRAAISNLQASDWSYFTGGDAEKPEAWSNDLTKASPILSRPGKCGWTSVCYVPALKVYLLTSWYVTPALKHWFKPDEVKYDFYQAEHPWGPWSFINSYSDDFLVGGHMYGPNICARYQEQIGSDVKVHLFTSGCPFGNKPTGLYKIWEIPLTLKTESEPTPTFVPHDDPALHYAGNWISDNHRTFSDHPEEVLGLHSSETPHDSVEYTFAGTGIDYVAEKFSNQGDADIFLDGVFQETASLDVKDFPRLTHVTIYSARHLATGEHTIKIVNKGSGFVNIQGFQVYMTDGNSRPSEGL